MRSLHVEKNGKIHPVYPGRPNSDQSQNLIDWSLAKDLLFHKIWFKSVNNFLRYPGNSQTDRQSQYLRTASLAEATIKFRMRRTARLSKKHSLSQLSPAVNFSVSHLGLLYSTTVFFIITIYSRNNIYFSWLYCGYWRYCIQAAAIRENVRPTLSAQSVPNR